MPPASDLVLPDYQGLPRPVTRFAPSPTGYLHIGGARTALFNLLHARAKGGSFLLRIEDTDRARSTDDAIAKILESLAWLGLEPDRPALFQFARAARHAEVAQRLLDRGLAYRCHATPEELEAMRSQQKEAGLPQRYDGRWRDRTDGPANAPYAVRLRAPTEGETVIADRVQGEVRQANAELDDFVLLRSDGTPTYMLAVVVDDQDMGVTDVIRGDDHLTNSFRQLALIRALEWPEPAYAHLPMIHGPDGAKLSKRHGALGVDAYADLGFLPEALENYLLRLGWGHGDTELVTREQAIALFDLGDVGRSPARFDLKKLESVNAHYLKRADNGRLVALVEPRIAESLGRAITDRDRDILHRGMDELKQRAKTLNELALSQLFLVRSRPMGVDEAAAKLLDAAGLGLLELGRSALVSASAWQREPLEAAVRTAAESAGLGLGKLAAPLRAALSGQAVAPSVFAVMAALGREESLGRIDDALGRRGLQLSKG